MKKSKYAVVIAIFMVGVFILSFMSEVGRIKKQLINDDSNISSGYNKAVNSNNQSLAMDMASIPVGISLKDYYNPLNFETQNAMWFTAMDYKGILLGKKELEFTAEIEKRFRNAIDIGINTIYIHTRINGDAYYNSDLFPSGVYMDSNIDYDPFQIMVDKAHSMGLSIHAWVNPLRCQTVSQMDNISDEYQTKKWVNDENTNGTVIVKLQDRYYLNPAYEEVRRFVAEGVQEIVSKYNVDGIHIDDYFYPTTEESFDKKSFEESGESDLANWRLDNCSKMVKEMYSKIKSENSRVLFGISPQGSISMDYKSQYADVKKWVSEKGYCDYIVPQLYYGFKNQLCPYEDTVDEWAEAVTEPSVKLIIGVCTYKIGTEDEWAGTGSQEWITDQNIPSRQIAYLNGMDNINGVAVYSYASTFEAETASQQVMAEITEIKKELNE